MKLAILFLLATATSAFMRMSPSRVASTSATTITTANINTTPVLKVHATPTSGDNGWSGEKRSAKPIAKNGGVSPFQRNTILDDTMIDPDYFLAISVACLGPLIIWNHPSFTGDGSPSLIGLAGGGFHLLFAALLWVQTRRVRLVFEKDAFEFYNIKGPKLDLENGAWLQAKPANYVAATPNRWKYDTIVNYKFFPSEQFPVIVYFKETETEEWKWRRWFAAFDSFGRGQPHFFPGICNVQQFKEQMELRGVTPKTKPSRTSESKN